MAETPSSDQIVARMLTALELELEENHPLKNQLENCAQNNSLVLGVDFPEIEKDPELEKKITLFFGSTPRSGKPLKKPLSRIKF